MRFISDDEVRALGISPRSCVEWTREALLMKPECQLPAKLSVHPRGNDFITTMPCLLPEGVGVFGVKVVSRVNGRHPALKSDLMLYDSVSGELLAVMGTDWVTAMRTGAVAALTVNLFRRKGARVFALMGLGSMARATMLCLLEVFGNEMLEVRLLRYKDQAERFAEEFAGYKNVSFSVIDSVEDWVRGADVVLSAITDAEGLIVEDLSWFKPGVLLVPIHMRGFENCDRVFDRVFGDDRGQLSGFRYFNEFKSFAELTEVLRGEKEGRVSDDERILCYNYGLGLHDVYFCWKIYSELTGAKSSCSTATERSCGNVGMCSRK